jgi:hypothetical protein
MAQIDGRPPADAGRDAAPEASVANRENPNQLSA